MIVNKCSENLLTKSKKLYENYRDNCTVVQRMLEKYKKIYPNISDYSIMHFIDIAEFCDLIMDRQKLEDLNGDECYCLLMAALFAHTGFGLNQEIMNKYINKLGIQKQTQSLTFLQIMSKYHVLFSACLIEEYGDSVGTGQCLTGQGDNRSAYAACKDSGYFCLYSRTCDKGW